MENSSEKSKFEQFRNEQKTTDFNKYQKAKGYEKPSTEADLKRIEISKSFMPYSEIPGNDR